MINVLSTTVNNNSKSGQRVKFPIHCFTENSIFRFPVCPTCRNGEPMENYDITVSALKTNGTMSGPLL